ncbi:hypothetical protein ACOMHN_043031 [Nucella lapillus]
MHLVFLLVVSVTGMLCAPSTDRPQQPFIALIRELEREPFFRQFSVESRVLTFEMLTAAETLNLTPLFDKLGYIQILKYIDNLPPDYSHRFISYSLGHLEQEAAAAVATAAKQP